MYQQNNKWKRVANYQRKQMFRFFMEDKCHTDKKHNEVKCFYQREFDGDQCIFSK
jgi:hypothetical protein